MCIGGLLYLHKVTWILIIRYRKVVYMLWITTFYIKIGWYHITFYLFLDIYNTILLLTTNVNILSFQQFVWEIRQFFSRYQTNILLHYPERQNLMFLLHAYVKFTFFALNNINQNLIISEISFCRRRTLNAKNIFSWAQISCYLHHDASFSLRNDEQKKC